MLGPVLSRGHVLRGLPGQGRGRGGHAASSSSEFSFPGGIGSHCTPETPGSIHEGGELGYSLSHAFGAAFDNPDLLVAVVVGDGEAETGPLATSWHINKFLNPIRDGAVLPILHLNGYKINNPTLLARISHEELESLFKGYGWTPYFVEGDDPDRMHQDMAAHARAMRARDPPPAADRRATSGKATRPRWPMIVLRTPKGWTGPAEVGGHKVEGYWRVAPGAAGGRARQSRAPEAARGLAAQLQARGAVRRATGAHARAEGARAEGQRGAWAPTRTPTAGLLRKPLRMPDFRDYAVKVDKPGRDRRPRTRGRSGRYLRDIMRQNMQNFRVFGPDENTLERLDAIYEVSKKLWLADYLPEDADGGELAPDGRVLEMLSEHTLEGWLEGYLLTGRHGFFSTYEAFAHVIDSMFNQHAKWLDICRSLPWRAPVASLNLLITSTVWRQDHNGFTHQDPGFLDVVVNKSPNVCRIYLPPDANTLLCVADHCLRSTDYINVIVCDKQKHLQYMTMDEAIAHCTKGIGIWRRRAPTRGRSRTSSWRAPATSRPRKRWPPWHCCASSSPTSRSASSTWWTSTSSCRHRASARPLRPGFRQPVHRRISRSSSTSTATRG